jgi:hypothetical protein
MSDRLDDPEFEPSDARLSDLAVRAFARIENTHGREVEHIRREIEDARATVLRVLESGGAR